MLRPRINRSSPRLQIGREYRALTVRTDRLVPTVRNDRTVRNAPAQQYPSARPLFSRSGPLPRIGRLAQIDHGIRELSGPAGRTNLSARSRESNGRKGPKGRKCNGPK
jgi:hypothetical protein